MRLTQTSGLSLRGGYSTYNPADGKTTGAYGLNAEWSNKVSDTSEYYARAGAQRVESSPDW
jgi:hypothetical protein